MKVLKNFLQYSFLTMLAIVVVSCSSDQTDTSNANATDVENTTELNTRSVATKVEAKAYYFKSLARFENGIAKLDLKDLASLQGKQVNLVVLYEATAPWASVFATGKFDQTGNDKLNGLMASYDLSIVKQFAIDDENEGFVLEPNAALDNPIEAARELSLVDNVLMVHVKEVPMEEDVEETASNN
jgi:hypothetical protein